MTNPDNPPRLRGNLSGVGRLRTEGPGASTDICRRGHPRAGGTLDAFDRGGGVSYPTSIDHPTWT